MSDQASELRQLLQQQADVARSPYRSIVFCSGKGGVGKTLLSLNIGIALAEEGIRTALLDMNWGMGDLSLFLHKRREINMPMVARGEKTLAQGLVDGPKGLKLLLSPCGSHELASLSGEARQSILKQIPDLSSNLDITLLDTGSGITESNLETAASADNVFLIVTPDAASITSTYAYLKEILSIKKEIHCQLIVTESQSKQQAVALAKGFSETSLHHLKCPVKWLGFVYNDSHITESVCNQTPVIIDSPKSKAAKCIREIAHEILKIPVELGQDTVSKEAE